MQSHKPVISIKPRPPYNACTGDVNKASQQLLPSPHLSETNAESRHTHVDPRMSMSQVAKNTNKFPSSGDELLAKL